MSPVQIKGQRLGPDFLSVWAQKAGTQWLFDQRQHHPDFWMPPSRSFTTRFAVLRSHGQSNTGSKQPHARDRCFNGPYESHSWTHEPGDVGSVFGSAQFENRDNATVRIACAPMGRAFGVFREVLARCAACLAEHPQRFRSPLDGFQIGRRDLLRIQVHLLPKFLDGIPVRLLIGQDNGIDGAQILIGARPVE